MDPNPDPKADPNPVARRVLDAAAASYLERGRDGTTLSRIATLAGVSRPTVYKYFGDRDAIADALIEREVGVYLGRLSDVLAEPRPAIARITEGIAFTVEYALRVWAAVEDPAYVAELAVIAMLVAEDETQSVLTATVNGYGKRTPVDE